MFGISHIGSYIPPARTDNLALAPGLDVQEHFIRSKIGFLQTARKADAEETSDLCVRAFEDLKRRSGLDPTSLDLLVVVTQNPDGHGLPHCSAIVHGKLGLPSACFAFDISLGCSGYVAGLAAVTGFMTSASLSKAVLITADPYSKVVDRDDRNTALIFGDAATATLIETGAPWRIGAFDFGTEGQRSAALAVNQGGKLAMNGRAVFDFCALNVPESVRRVLERSGLALGEIDRFVFHPGSKYIVDVIARRLGIKAPEFEAATYGNTVSSSIPLILSRMQPSEDRTLLLSGFGVGLSWATCVLRSNGETC